MLIYKNAFVTLTNKKKISIRSLNNTCKPLISVTKNKLRSYDSHFQRKRTRFTLINNRNLTNRDKKYLIWKKN